MATGLIRRRGPMRATRDSPGSIYGSPAQAKPARNKTRALASFAAPQQHMARSVFQRSPRASNRHCTEPSVPPELVHGWPDGQGFSASRIIGRTPPSARCGVRRCRPDDSNLIPLICIQGGGRSFRLAAMRWQMIRSRWVWRVLAGSYLTPESTAKCRRSPVVESATHSPLGPAAT
jgi:hypothetical protein